MFKKKLLNTLLVASLLLTSFSYLPKAASYSSEEIELNKLIQSNSNKNITYDDGVLLESNESMDISQLKNFKISNTKVAQVKNGVLTGKQEGTTFASYTEDNNVYIKEVSVTSIETLKKSNTSKIESTPSSRTSYKVSLDPGHGGSDPGASGNGLIEKEINLETAKLVAGILKNNGIEFEFTRTDDSYVSLLERVKAMNSYAPDVAVSIHYNSSTNVSANGIETYYTGTKLNKQLASNIQTFLISNTGATDRCIKTATFTVIQKTNCTSALVEGGFISNTIEVTSIATEEYKKKIAQGIADGIMEFLRNNIAL